MREKVTHPATPRELIEGAQDSAGRARDIPPPAEVARHDRRARARPKAAASGCPTRWTSSSAVCRCTRPASASSFPTRPAATRPTCTCRPPTSRRRCTAIACSCASSGGRPRTALEGRIIRILERGNSTIVGRFDVDGLRPRLRAAVRSPHRDRRARADRSVGSGRARRDGRGGNHDVADGDRAVRSARSSKCSATSTSRASTPKSSSASTAFPTCTARPRSRKRSSFGPVSAKDIDGPHRFSSDRSPSRSTASTRATSTTRSASRGCRTGTTGSACTSPTWRTT